jgi:general secretion pathway protein F
MPAFSFEAVTQAGEMRTGVLDAESARSVRTMLRAQSLVPLSVQMVKGGFRGKIPASADGASLFSTADVGMNSPGGTRGTRGSSGASGFAPSLFNRSVSSLSLAPSSRVFSSAALMIWTRQLASLVGSGLPLERALTALIDEAASPKQRNLVASLRAEVNAGATLGKALKDYPGEFPELFIAVISSGEQTGRLADVLERLAGDLERAQSLKNKLLAAVLYPAIVSVVAFAIVMFLLAYVVPQVANVFAGSHHALPLITTIMLAISGLIRTHWPWMLSLLIVTTFSFQYALGQERFKLKFDTLWLRLPLLGKLSLGYNSARFASTLALLSGAGVPILKSLETAAQTLSNTALRVDALQALVLVREGAPLASALAQNARLPSMLCMFARLGEQTGQLPQMLDKAAHHLGSEVERRALNLATVLEPLLIVAMGVVVLMIVLAVMLPIIQLNQWVH